MFTKLLNIREILMNNNPVHNGPNDRVKRKKMLIVIFISKVLMDFFHLYLEILNVNKRIGLCIERFQFLFLRILVEIL